MKSLLSQRGQLMIEAIVALGILTVTVFSIFGLVARATSLNTVVSQQYAATYLAAEGIELAKNIMDSNLIACPTRAWEEGAVNGSYEVQYNDDRLFRDPAGRRLLINADGLYQYDSGEPTPFKRTITLEKVIHSDPSIRADQEVRVTSKVMWTGRGGTSNDVRLEDHLFKWRPAPADCS